MKKYRHLHDLEQVLTRVSGPTYSVKDYLAASSYGSRTHGFILPSGNIYASYEGHGQLLFKCGLDRKERYFTDLQKAAMRSYKLIRISALICEQAGDVCVELQTLPTDKQRTRLTELRQRTSGHRFIVDAAPTLRPALSTLGM